MKKLLLVLLVLASAAGAASAARTHLQWPLRLASVRRVATATLTPAPDPSPAAPDPGTAEGPARSAIVFLGDGMGLPHITAARIHAHGPGGRLAMERMPVTGLISTHSADNLVTKSDAAATALATGRKTANGRIGVDPDGKRLPSIVEVARDAGFATGLVTTSAIIDATPASFGSHVPARGDYDAIAEQLIEARIDILFGTGREFFLPRSHPGSERHDDLDLLARAQAQGDVVLERGAGLSGADGGRLLGLFAEEDRPPLAEMTHKALEILSRRERGFFLLAEHEGIDQGGHDNDAPAMLRSLLEFDEAVARGLDFARNDGRTLVLVLGDHETGGLQLDRQGEDGRELQLVWTTTDHTGAPVPLFAFGPGAHRFTGLKDNTEIPSLLAEALGLPAFPPQGE